MEHDDAPSHFTVGKQTRSLAKAAALLAGAYAEIGILCDIDTPQRVARWLAEYATPTEGELIDDSWVVEFASEHSEMVVTKDMSFVALCEHHLLPFRGKAAIGYIPTVGGKVLGLSKFARLLQLPCAQPTLQEDITSQIADAIMAKLAPMGCAVMLYDVEHTCMTTRGIKDTHANTTTCAVRGVFLDNDRNSRDEFLRMVFR